MTAIRCPGHEPDRTRQTLLFVAAILVPCALLVALTLRMLIQGGRRAPRSTAIRMFADTLLLGCAQRPDVSLDNHIASIRATAEQNASDPQHLLTVHGVGDTWVL